MSLDAKLREARDQAEKLRDLRADMQPEHSAAVYRGGQPVARVADLPAAWRGQPRPHATEYWLGWVQGRDAAADELEKSLANEPHISITADALKTLASTRDLEKRVAQLQREVDGYRRALSSIIAVHMLEVP